MNKLTYPKVFHLLALFLTGCSLASSQSPTETSLLSQEEAAQIVIAQVILPDELEGELIAFAWGAPLQPADKLIAFNPPGFDSPSQPISFVGEAWFFWLDDAPGAKFAHPSRFVTVDRGTGVVTVMDEQWWPVLNGENILIERPDYWNEDNWIFSNVEWRPGTVSGDNRSPLIKVDLMPRQASSPKPVDGETSVGAAIVISGDGNTDSQNQDLATDANSMFDLLTNAGFDTTYLGPESDSNPDRSGGNDLDTIGDKMNEVAKNIEPGQSLVIYITGHGFVSDKDGMGFAAGVSEDLLEIWLSGIDPSVNIIIIIDSCYSGSFVDTTRTFADATVTSTGPHDTSWFDRDSENDPNPEDEGSEFTSGFVEDWNEIMSDPAEVARVRAKAESRAENFWRTLTGEAYISALEKDAAFIDGLTFPQLVPGVAGTSPTATLTPTIVPTPTITSTPTNTLTPTITLTPTLEVLTATVNVGTASCRHGPSEVFLFKYGLVEDTEVTINGRLGSWGLVQPKDFNGPCWIWSGLLDVNGDFNTAGFMNYVNYLPREYEFAPPPSGVGAVRNNGTVTTSWDAAIFNLPADFFGYLIDTTTCQNGLMTQMFYQTMDTMLSFGDGDNCSQTSTATIYNVHKDGYSESVTINLP